MGSEPLSTSRRSDHVNENAQLYTEIFKKNQGDTDAEFAEYTVFSLY